MNPIRIALEKTTNPPPLSGSQPLSKNSPSPNSQFKVLLSQNSTPVVESSQEAMPVTISAHARERLLLRNITINDDDMVKISNAMNKILEKGGNNSVIFMQAANGKDAAMIVSARNRVIITAVDPHSLKENIFTNIDSAAFVSQMH